MVSVEVESCKIVDLGCWLNTSARLLVGAKKHDGFKHVLRDHLHWLRVPQRVQFKLCHSADVQGAPWCGTAVYRRSLPASHISWQQTETPIRHSRRPRGQLFRHALRRPCIRCGGPKGMEPAAGAFSGTRDSWPLQDLSSLYPVTVPNCLTRRALVMTIHVRNGRRYYYYYYFLFTCSEFLL